MYKTEETLKKIEAQLLDLLESIEELRHEMRYQNHDVVIDHFKDRVKMNLILFKRSFLDAFRKGWIF